MILDGRQVVASKMDELKSRVEKLDKVPKLVIIKVGNDPASAKYVANKIAKCAEVGIDSKVMQFNENVSESIIEDTIKVLNNDTRVTAILLQLPIPKHLDENKLTEMIIPKKDVDGFTSTNIGKLVLGEEGNVACTPSGIMTLLKHYNIPLKGKDVLIINRSNIVGKPLAHLLLQEDATVTIAHSKTKDLKDKIKNYNIIVTAVGKANFFNAEDFYYGQTVIDVSINFDNGKMCGDVRKADYPKLDEMEVLYSPVPNGIGQLTVMSLIEQTIKIAERSDKNG